MDGPSGIPLLTGNPGGAAYVLVTPARNEGALLPATIESVAAQRVPPRAWVIVDDGSNDGTWAVALEASRRHPFIRALRAPPGEAGFGSKARAFNAGVGELEGVAFDYIGNLDADVTFGPDYFGDLISEFEADPRLGVAGGEILEWRSGAFRPRIADHGTVAGAVQLFRRECFSGVGGYLPLPAGGIDTIAEGAAKMNGWTVRTIPALKVLHHRRVGTSRESLYRSRFRFGRREYHLGTHPLFLAAKSIHRMRESPFLIGSLLLLAGFLVPFLRREKLQVPPGVVEFRRREQMAKLKRTLWGRMEGRRSNPPAGSPPP